MPRFKQLGVIASTQALFANPDETVLELPRSLTLQGTPLNPASSVWNVIDGERYGIRVVAFDCRIGYGKGSWRRMVIAAQSPGDVFGAVNYNRELPLIGQGNGPCCISL